MIAEGDIFLKEDGAETIRTWGSEKTAVQWMRRMAERESMDVALTKLDGTLLYLKFAVEVPPPPVKLGKHEWKKANLLNLADHDGPYDKLYCIHCGLIARRYRRLRHFRVEFDCCPKNPLPCEATP